MVDENSLGPLGPNIINIESISDTVYSVHGNNFAPGFRVEVQDGIGKPIAGAGATHSSRTDFTLTLPYRTPGPCTLSVINPDNRASVQRFATPGTSASNEALRANS